jgi:hypothetical protein
MNFYPEFEILAKLHGLDINKNNHNYLNPNTELANIFWQAQQVKIDKLTHDLVSADCAARMLAHVLDNPVKQCIEEGTPA